MPVRDAPQPPTSPSRRRVRSTVRMACSLSVTVGDGRVVAIDGSHANPATQRVHLRQGPAIRRARLRRQPRCAIRWCAAARKGSGTFERVSWDEALEAIAARIRSGGAWARHGGEAVLPYSYGGSNGFLTQDAVDTGAFFRRLGASRLDRTVCAAPTGRGRHWALRQDAGGGVRRFSRRAPDCRLGRQSRRQGNTHLVPILNRGAEERHSSSSSFDPRRTQLARALPICISRRAAGNRRGAGPGGASASSSHRTGGPTVAFLAAHSTGWEEAAAARAGEWTFDRAAAGDRRRGPRSDLARFTDLSKPSRSRR